MNLCYISLYATHFIVTDKLTKAVDSIILGIIQLGFAGALGLVFSLFFEIPRFPITTQEWLPILVLSILCSAIGFIVQTVAQQHTTSTNTGLIFSLEPVFASIFAFLVLDEILSTQGLVGAMLVLLGVIYSQVNWKRGNNSLASKLYTPQNKMMLQNVPSKSHVMNCLKSSHQSTVFFSDASYSSVFNTCCNSIIYILHHLHKHPVTSYRLNRRISLAALVIHTITPIISRGTGREVLQCLAYGPVGRRYGP